MFLSLLLFGESMVLGDLEEVVGGTGNDLFLCEVTEFVEPFSCL